MKQIHFFLYLLCHFIYLISAIRTISQRLLCDAQSITMTISAPIISKWTNQKNELIASICARHIFSLLHLASVIDVILN